MSGGEKREIKKAIIVIFLCFAVIAVTVLLFLIQARPKAVTATVDVPLKTAFNESGTV